jgi:hypothetical protein
MTSLETAARRAAMGDGQAFEAVCRALQDDVWRYCSALVGDGEMAAEAAQETFLRSVRAIGASAARRRCGCGSSPWPGAPAACWGWRSPVQHPDGRDRRPPTFLADNRRAVRGHTPRQDRSPDRRTRWRAHARCLLVRC